MLKNLLVGALFCCLSSIYAQQNNFKNYGENEGLKHPFIKSVVQDSVGYIWVGTSEGLYRYDGLYFDAFKQDINDSISISDNYITCIYVDPDKSSLWVGTHFGGINRLDLRSFKFDQIQRKTDSLQKDRIGVVTALLRYKSWLFIGTRENGVLLYNIEEKSFVDLRVDNKNDVLKINDLTNNNGIIIFSTDKGLYEYDTSKIEKDNYTLEKAFYCHCSQRVNSMSLENDSTLLVCLDRKLVRRFINSDNSEIIFEDAKNSSLLTKHLVDENNNIWIGTYGNGLIQLSANGDILNKYLAEDRLGSLSNNWISTLYFSKAHSMLWVGTKDGLSMLDYSSEKFKSFKANEKQGILTDNLFFLFKDSDKRYWWWSYNGFYTHKEAEKPKKYLTPNGQSLDDDTINSGYEDENNTIWFATFNGLLKIDSDNKSYNRISFKDGEKLYYNIISDIVPREEYIWLITYGGLIKYDAEANTYKQYPFPASFNNHNRVKTSIGRFDRDGKLWIGDKDGYLISFNEADATFERFSTALNSEQGNIRYSAVFDVHIKDDNTVWLATFGAGLISFNKTTKSISSVDSNELLNNNIYSIYYGLDGNYWLNSNSNIIRYNSDEKSILSFGRNEGTLCREFNERSHYAAPDGNILMGGFGGFVEFNPKDFPYNTRVPAVEVSSYFLGKDHDMVGDQVYYNLEFIEGDTLVISTDDNDIAFNPSVLSFQNSDKNMVAWMLEGYDQDWDTLMAYDSKDYSALPEGKYTLRFKGCNNHQYWNDEGDTIYLVVKSTFFQSKLFKLLLVILCLLLFFAFYKVRINYLRKQKVLLEKLILKRTQELQESNHDLEESKEEVVTQKKELERHRYYLEDLVRERTVDLELAKERAVEADRLKSAFLANLSHEIRTPMNSIVGFSTLLTSDLYDPSERKEFVSMVQKSSDSLLVLINDIIDISQIETGQVQLVNKCFGVKEHCSIVFKSLTLNSSNNGVKYVLDTNDIGEGEVLCSDPERLKQILNNLLSNAIKFTNRGHVLLRVLNGTSATKHLQSFNDGFDLSDEMYLFIVEDTGIGIELKHHENIFSPFQKVEDGPDLHGGIGLGLSIVKQLVEMLGGKIGVNSKVGEGTTFYFFIPKGKLSQSLN